MRTNRSPRRLRAGLVAAAVGVSLLATTPAAHADTVTTVASAARAQGLEVRTTFDPAPSDDADPVVDLVGGITRAESRVDTGGIGGGTATADGAGTGALADAAGVFDIDFSVADSHLPTAEALPDTGVKASEDAALLAGLISASGLASESDAVEAPAGTFTSTNSSTVASASLAPTNDPANPVVPVSAEAFRSDASATGSDTGDGAADASSGVADITIGTTTAEAVLAAVLPPGTIPVGATIDSVVLSTSASVDLAGSPDTSCVVTITTAEVVIPGAVTIPPVVVVLTCAEVAPLIDPIFPIASPELDIVIDVELGAPVLDGVCAEPPFGDAADSTGVVGLRATVVSPTGSSIVDLATSEACTVSRDEETGNPTVCDTEVADAPTASGAAAASGAEVRDVLNLSEIALGSADAAVDEAGLALAPDSTMVVHGPDGADAATSLLSADLYLPPNDERGPLVDPTDTIRLVDTDADAPLAETESFDLAELGADAAVDTTSNVVLGSLTADTVSSLSDASTSPDAPDQLRLGDASASINLQASGADLDLTGGPDADVSLASETLTSTADSTVGPSSVTSTATQLIQGAAASAAANGDPVDVSATVIETTGTTATADGTPGGASATTDFTVVDLSVAGVDIAFPTDGPDDDSWPDETVIPITVGDVLIATVYLAEVDRTVSPDGTFATISVNPVRVEIPDANGGPDTTEIVLGHTEATASYPSVSDSASMVTSKTIDRHMAYAEDARQITGPDGTPESSGLLAPHQKFFIELCVGNAGGSDLTGVTVSDTLNGKIRLITEAPGDTIHAGLDVDDRTVTASIGTLAPGEEERVLLFVEIKPNATVGASFQNRGVASSDQTGTVTSAPVPIEVGYNPDEPALRVKNRLSCDRTTRTWLLETKIQNDGGATAFDARIDQVTVKKPNGGVVTGLAISGEYEDIPPGEDTEIRELEIPGVPGAPGTPCGKLQIIYREVTLVGGPDSANRQLLAFD